MEPVDPLQPLDPLDRLLRGGMSDPWPDRLRRWCSSRLAWVVAGVVVVGITVVVLVVRPTGAQPTVSLPRAGTTPAGESSAGESSAGARSVASSSAVEVTTTSVGGGVVVHVAGAVVSPGLISLPAGSRVADAIAGAGGLGPDADGDRVNLAEPLVDGVRVYVPVRGQPDPPAPAAVSGGAATGGSAAPSEATPVDLNRATVDDLDALPGVGPATAAAIVAYRDEHRRFATVDELQEVRGIGPAKFEALESMVTVGP